MADKGERLDCLDAAVIQLMRQLLGDGFDVTENSSVQENWKPGSASTEIVFEDCVSHCAVEKFRRLYSYYVVNTRRSTLASSSKCEARVNKVVEYAKRHCKDLGVRFIQSQIVVCGTQEALNRDLGSIENELLFGDCLPGCLLCRAASRRGKGRAGGIFLPVEPSDKRYSHGESFREHSSQQYASGGGSQFDERGIRIKIEKGNLTKAIVDGIVNTTNAAFSLSGPLSKSIIQEGGHRIEREIEQARKQYKFLALSQVVVTSAGDLKCRCVLHVNPQADDPNPDCVRQAVLSVLHKAHELGLNSLAMPAIGSGFVGVKTEDAARAIFSALAEFESRLGSSSSLQEVHLIDKMGDSVYELSKQYCEIRRIPFEERTWYNKFRDKFSKTLYR